VILREAVHVRKSGGVNTIAEVIKVGLSFGEFEGAACYQLIFRQDRVGRREKICCFVNIEGKDGVDSMCGEVWRATKGSRCGNSFRPESGIETLRPLRGISVDDLEHDLAEVPVLPFDWTVGLGVVTGDTNVIDTVLRTKLVEGGDIRCSIVGDEFRYGSVSAEEVLEDKVHEGAASL
jgi:hypothetical protein